MKTKGIILAGGSGTRLAPNTLAVSKQLLPVYDKPMIYYPLSTLMLAGIREILIISTERDVVLFESLLGDGTSLGVNISYETQNKPNGIAEALIIGENFLNGSASMLLLGDNIFYGANLTKKLTDIIKNSIIGAKIFAYSVGDPQRFGVVEFDQEKNVLSIEEKPVKPKSNFAVTGMYLFDSRAVEYAKELKPSPRGELEITDLNSIYLRNRSLSVEILGRGYYWSDVGTPESLLTASQIIQLSQKQQGYLVACPEEIALKNGWITSREILRKLSQYGSGDYALYLQKLINSQ